MQELDTCLVYPIALAGPAQAPAHAMQADRATPVNAVAHSLPNSEVLDKILS